MKIIFAITLSLVYLNATPISAAEDTLFYDRSHWKLMTSVEKTIYLNGLQTGMVMGALVPPLAYMKMWDATYEELATYLDNFYKDIRNMRVAVPFVTLILGLEVRGESQEGIDEITRSMREKSQIEMVLWLKNLSDETTRKSKNASQTSDRQISDDLLLDH